MTPLHVQVPKLNDGHWDHRWLFTLWQWVAQRSPVDLTLSFTDCRFLRQNAVAFLGALAREVQRRSGRVTFHWNTMPEAVRTNLAQNGFMSAQGGPGTPWRGNSIPYREDRERRPQEFSEFLANQWLGRDWVRMSGLLKDHIASRVGELHVNAFQHSKSPVGVMTCGQHYPKQELLELTLVDLGVGIPSNVRLHKMQAGETRHLPASACLEWALQKGASTSTAPEDSTKGLGLSLLTQFICDNKGWMDIYSHEGHLRVDGAGVKTTDLDVGFEGTLITIGLRCDERFYIFADEVGDDQVF